MTITTTTFRQTEAMLLAAFPNADVLVSIIGLAIETMGSAPEASDIKEAEPIVLSLPVLADRLNWDHREAIHLLRVCNMEMLADLGFIVCRFEGDRLYDEDEIEAQGEQHDLPAPVRVIVSDTLSALLRGTALIAIEADDPRAMAIDSGSTAMVALIARLSAVGGGVLYREPETADERVPELFAMAATLAAHPAIQGRVFIHRSSYGRVSIPPTAAIIAAVLHGAGVIVIMDELLEASQNAVGTMSEDYDELSKNTSGWRSMSSDGVRLGVLLPHVSCAVLVPIERDAILAPHVASVFVTAVGPLRRDRAAAQARLREMTDGRLSDAIAERLYDLWDGRVDRARTSVEAVGRMIAGPTRASGKRAGLGRDPMFKTSVAFSVLTEAMAAGMMSHVWSPGKRQPKPKPSVFHKQLFICKPDASVLFSDQLKDEPSIRVMFFGASGTGKSAAAAYIATHVLGMATYHVLMSDILHYRLGALERAIAAAFREARESNAVIILDEADSVAQDRETASPGAVHLVTATTNALLLELDRHPLPVVLCTNFAQRIDPAVKRRFDLSYEVKSIPEALEIEAVKTLLGFDPPQDFEGFTGESVVSDYISAKRQRRLLGGDSAALLAAVQQAGNLRLGRNNAKASRIGF